jgi:hypothetical protein
MPEFLKASDLKAAGITFTPGYLKRLEAAGQFPNRIALGPRKSVWLRSDVEAYIADKIAASRRAA